ncbi:MAG: molybdate ABC transporter substrate-binding protein [Myxococcota bacterium]
MLVLVFGLVLVSGCSGSTPPPEVSTDATAAAGPSASGPTDVAEAAPTALDAAAQAALLDIKDRQKCNRVTGCAPLTTLLSRGPAVLDAVAATLAAAPHADGYWAVALTDALGELGAAFQAKTGIEVAPTFGASKLLATQINQGAPFDLFMSADVKQIDAVIAEGGCDAGSKALYGRGHLVIWTRDGGVKGAESLAELADARFRRIAIANPDTAPYGAAARAALEKAGLWSELEARIVKGENLRQALQMAESGNADVAIVSRSLAIGSKGVWHPIDDALHAPIEQALVVCHGGKALADFILGPEGQAILARWGLDR